MILFQGSAIQRLDFVQPRPAMNTGFGGHVWPDGVAVLQIPSSHSTARSSSTALRVHDCVVPAQKECGPERAHRSLTFSLFLANRSEIDIYKYIYECTGLPRTISANQRQMSRVWLLHARAFLLDIFRPILCTSTYRERLALLTPRLGPAPARK